MNKRVISVVSETEVSENEYNTIMNTSSYSGTCFGRKTPEGKYLIKLASTKFLLMIDELLNK
jgi:hypothetical protein